MDFDNKSKESTENFNKSLKDKVNEFIFIKLLQFSLLIYQENFNNYAKISRIPILHRGTTQEVYLEPSQTSAMELFYKNY